MDELFKIAQYYTVLRDGETVGSGAMDSISSQELIEKMVGRELIFEKKAKSQHNQEIALTVKKLSLKHPHIADKNILKDIGFSVYKGEILGIFGLMGAGRTELLQTIFGLNPKISNGQIAVFGNFVEIKNPQMAIQHKIAFVTEDRKSEGLILNMDISKNISITTLNSAALLNSNKESVEAQKHIETLGIKTPHPSQLCENLSGGNQQKVVLAKWLATNPAILLLDEPTRGIDIKAKSEFYEVIRKLAESGKSIVLVSSEIPEILALSDRILVMAEGQIKAEFNINEATESLLLANAI